MGRNEIKLTTSECQLDFVIYRLPDTNVRFVRVLYVVCSDQNVSPLQQAHDLNRIELNAKLLQTFIAEQMVKQKNGSDGWRRKTIRFGSSSSSVVDVFASEMSLSEARSMRPNELFVRLADEIKKRAYEPNAKFMAVLSFTVYKDEATHDEIKEGANKIGYCALGILDFF